MSVPARIRHRFFAFRSMSPARRCALSESSPRSRWELRCRQFISSDFSVLQLNNGATVTGTSALGANGTLTVHGRYFSAT